MLLYLNRLCLISKRSIKSGVWNCHSTMPRCKFQSKRCKVQLPFMSWIQSSCLWIPLQHRTDKRCEKDYYTTINCDIQLYGKFNNWTEEDLWQQWAPLWCLVWRQLHWAKGRRTWGWVMGEKMESVVSSGAISTFSNSLSFPSLTITVKPLHLLPFSTGAS